jgi:hypothetical protein
MQIREFGWQSFSDLPAFLKLSFGFVSPKCFEAQTLSFNAKGAVVGVVGRF